MSESILKRCRELRSDAFPAGLLPEWLKVTGPVIEAILPFPGEHALQALVSQDAELNAYTWRVSPAIESLPKQKNQTAISARNVIAIASGKGGVGKSSVTVNLAYALAESGARVGIVDADIYGPSLPTMLGWQGNRPEFDAQNKMSPVLQHGLELNSLGFLVDRDDATIWRGPMASRALEQLFFDTRWNNLDYLLVDMPPGTGDIQLTLAQKLPVTAAVIVTTPQDVALDDARKGIDMFRKVNVPVIGLLENMSYFECSSCGHRDMIFGQDGGSRLAAKYQVPVIGQWPLITKFRESLDQGLPFLLAEPNHAMSEQVRNTAELMAINAWMLLSPHAKAYEEDA
ncbi:MAG: iron-sulfur cluster carrier protein ApbC [Idiomarina sp.]|nr:iron-sulfur cluster carrier protein ApbC [Idiomarina sp.]